MVNSYCPNYVENNSFTVNVVNSAMMEEGFTEGYGDTDQIPRTKSKAFLSSSETFSGKELFYNLIICSN